MKKCIVISDSFKGTLSSMEICQIARESIPRIFPDCELITIPVADGGEGTVACFIEALDAEPVSVSVTGPYGEPIYAVYARTENRAIVEMSSAAGLPMVGERRDPSSTTTYGVGQVIRHAIEHGCTEILLGLGGSATNDAGCGCAAALGVRFQNNQGDVFTPVGKTMDQINLIDLSGSKSLLNGVKITVMCDVDNPLYGTTGAANVFGPQKGADSQMVAMLDHNLRKLAEVIKHDLSVDIADMPGAGAAGGMGAGCVAFLGAELKSGIEAVLDMVEFDRCLNDADLVITGEGRIDSQSVHGKVISGIAKRTAPRQLPLIAIVGCIDPSAEEAYDLGITAMFTIDREAKAYQDYVHETAENYRRTLVDVLRCIDAIERKNVIRDTE